VLYLCLLKDKTKMQLFKNNQKGFALLHILPAFVLVAAIAFVGGSVYQAQVKKRDAARQSSATEDAKKLAELSAQKDEAPAEEEKVEVPSAAEEQKPVATAPAPKPTTTTKTTPKPSYTTVNISNHNIVVDEDNVTITLTLPSAYTGVCATKVKLLPNYDQYEYKEASFSNTNTCSVTFSKATLLSKGTSWKAFPSWRNSDYTVKGGYDGFDFNL
jgi:cytoskeletal protein RodZ